MFKTFKFYGKNNDSFLKKLTTKLNNHGIKETNNNPELIISIGGDGTFLSCIHKYQHSEDPTFFSIKKGTLGFYSDYTVHQIDELVTFLTSNNHKLIRVPLLAAQVNNYVYYAINEIKIINHLKVLNYSIDFCDFNLETIRGSGVYFSSSFGSTGFNKTCGGPIITNYENDYVFGEIHSVNNVYYRSLRNPLVISKPDYLHVKIKSGTALLINDNIKKMKIKEDQNIKFWLSERKIKLLRSPDFNILKKIKSSFTNIK